MFLVLSHVQLESSLEVCSMKIVDVKVQSYSYPMPALHGRRFGAVQEATIVRIQTDDGLEGYGSARAQGGTSGRVIAEAVLATAKPRLLGEDPFQREKLWQRLWALDRASYMQIFVTGAIDVALWDLAGKALGAPVWQLLGGYREKLPAYASSAFMEREEQYVEEALACLARGYPAYKIHPFGDAERDIRLCRAVREAVGPEAVLMLDPVGAYDHHQAMRVGRELERLDFYWYEEPLIDYDLRGYAELCRDLDIPVVAGETMAGSIMSTAQYIDQRAGDILRADVYWRGGITGVMKTAHLCEAFGLKMELHHAATPIMDMANLHCACAIRNCDYFEVLVPETSYRYGLKHYADIDPQGYVHAPSGPGLGVDIDWDYIENNTTFAG
jgi:L-alanine-DL-glutamate epimerase-like enolase superfamily enzyme